MPNSQSTPNCRGPKYERGSPPRRQSLRWILLALAWALSAPSAAAPPSDAITGIWLNQAKEGYVQIYQTPSGDYAGRIVGDTSGVVARDVHNPNPAKRDESLLGKQIFHSFEYNGEGRWEDGEIYNPKNGKTYSAWLGLSEDDRLKVHGYIGFSLFGLTKLFTRVQQDAVGVVESALLPSQSSAPPADANPDRAGQ